uniref:Serpin domain-containing protein n=1 Tax=Pseudonaja textilis TaxID=8673 RepID=A0A670Z837_PSETE
MDKLANAKSQFALDLFQQLTEAHPTDNVFFSPISISSALAMIALGARGNTASELSKVIAGSNIGRKGNVIAPASGCTWFCSWSAACCAGTSICLLLDGYCARYHFN